jgi:hypothetical protein
MTATRMQVKVGDAWVDVPVAEVKFAWPVAWWSNAPRYRVLFTWRKP